jgi:TolB-like protein/Tfp pilus assembly protein PilF
LSLFNELKRRNVLRVAAGYIAVSWLLIQVVETLFPVFGLSDSSIRLVVIVLTIGFPLIVVSSWLYELTPEGLKKDKDVDRSSAQAHHTGKQLDRAIIIVMAFSLGYFAIDKFVLDPARDAKIAETATQKGRTEALVESYGERSIAVLPFVNMSDDSSNEYFSDGISEELLNLLAKIPRLRVTSRSSAFSFKGKDISIPLIAAQLGVAHVLEGSVRKAGNKVRITAQLIEARSDVHLWSETYDRELSDIFAVQDEISAAIVRALKISLGLKGGVAPRATATANTDAHEAFLRGRYLVIQRTGESIDNSILEFEKAVDLDPDYAQAHAELAMATLLSSLYGEKDEDEALSEAGPHVVRALALDSSLAEAQAAAGFLSVIENGFGEESAGYLEKAVEINPNYSDAYNWLADSYAQSVPPKYKKAIAARAKAVQLDPLSQRALHNYVRDLIDRNRADEADEILEKLSTMDPAKYAHQMGYRKAVGGKSAYNLLGYLDHLLLKPESKSNRALFRTFLAELGFDKEAKAVFEEPRWMTLIKLGQIDEALAFAQAKLAEDPDSQWFTNLVAFTQPYAGKFEQARPTWEEWWLEDPGWLSNTDQLAAFIAIRRHAGEEDQVGELLDVMRERASWLKEGEMTVMGMADYGLGLADFLAGEREQGLAMIKEAVEFGYFVPRNAAFLQSLYDDPGYAPIQTILQALIQRERARFLDVVCNDNPYGEVWQPQPGTCEEFLLVSETP